MFCIVTVVRVHVLYCDSGTREEKFEKHCPVASIKRSPSLIDVIPLTDINFALSYIWDVPSDTSGTVIV